MVDPKNLNNTKRRAAKVVLSLALFALSVGGMTSIATAQEQGSALAAPIEGTWIVQVHRVTQGVTFTALQSFTAGGVTLATGTLDRTPPPSISPCMAHGNAPVTTIT